MQHGDLKILSYEMLETKEFILIPDTSSNVYLFEGMNKIQFCTGKENRPYRGSG
jgi:hypothetical protein